MYDLVIRGGKVVDGTGSPARYASVAISGDLIVAIGDDVGPGREEIDAEGLLVTPGWVDIHTHYDGQALWDSHLTPSGWNGVTTVVMGNCGVGFAPVRPDQGETLIDLMEAVEDIPSVALREGIQFDWVSFPEYLDALERTPRAIDVAAQVPHCALRVYVMGDRGKKNEEATTDEIEEMAALVKEGLEAGALGFSTSRTVTHRTTAGELIPGTTASEKEMLGIGAALGEVGHGVFGVVTDFVPDKMKSDLISAGMVVDAATEGDELRWMRKLTKETGRPVTFLCIQSPADAEQWRRLLVASEESAAEGGSLTPQVAQRPAGFLLSFDSSYHAFMARPAFRELTDLSSEERLAKLALPEVREAILSQADEDMPLGAPEMIAGRWNHMFRLGNPPDYEPAPEKSIAAIAKQQGRSPEEVSYDLMLSGEFIFMTFIGYENGDLEAIREMMVHERTVYGLSDGGAHCGLVSDANAPTFLLTHWVRDRKRGMRLPLEAIVERQTRRTAAFYEMHDRGVLAPGMKADVNIIDFEGLKIHSPKMVWDLPANCRRIVQAVDGYRYTIKSGEVIYRNGIATGALPGGLVRGPQGPQ